MSLHKETRLEQQHIELTFAMRAIEAISTLALVTFSVNRYTQAIIFTRIGHT